MTDANPSGARKGRSRVPTTPEEREKKLQNMAYDLAEEQLASGKASSQLMTLLIKGGGIREQREMEKLSSENRLLNARIESLESTARLEESIGAALEAFKTYTGESFDDPDD